MLTNASDTDIAIPWLPTPRVRVLLAEDDADVRQALSRLLRRDGYVVRTVNNGQALVNVLSPWILGESEPPADLIVTDMRMPGFNGLSVVEGLRACGWWQPVLLISAFADEHVQQRISSMKDVAFLPKPFDDVDLENALSKLLAPELF
ncbi:MAG: response regulator [Archangium sp.]|nr:response regulator [Archangium sp.]